MIFKNWLDTPPKMETHDPAVYPTILGGVSRGFWSPFEDSDAQSAKKWHLKTGTFGYTSTFDNTEISLLYIVKFSRAVVYYSPSKTNTTSRRDKIAEVRP